MRKVIIAIVLLAMLTGGYVWLSRQQVRIGALEGEQATTRRGDLVIPITASGKIEPASVRNMKCEASGEVVATPFDIGAMVKQNDLILRLDESDERRNVDRAEAELERAKMVFQKAEIIRDQARTVGVPLAAAKLAQVSAQYTLAEISHNKQIELKALKEKEDGLDAASRLEFAQSEARLQEAKAVTDAAKAELNQAGIAIQMAEKDVRTAAEAMQTAQKAYEEAMERLSETTVLSPIDGMILTRPVQVGEMVLSGTMSLTGGTLVMQIADVSEIYAVVNVDEADIGRVRQLAPASARPGPTATRPAPAANRPVGVATQPEAELTTFPAGVLEEGQKVEISVESFEDERFYGAIKRISPQSELVQAIATFKVWIRITSENRSELIGLLNTQCEARFTARSVRDAVLVSWDAMKPNPDGEGYGVYVPVLKPGKTKPTPEFRRCKFGADNGIDVEVIEGLKEGQQVYTKLPIKTEKERKAEERAEDAERGG